MAKTVYLIVDETTNRPLRQLGAITSDLAAAGKLVKQLNDSHQRDARILENISVPVVLIVLDAGDIMRIRQASELLS